MDEVDLYAVEPGAELCKSVEFALAGAPVVPVCPHAEEVTQVSVVGALGPRLAGRRTGQPEERMRSRRSARTASSTLISNLSTGTTVVPTACVWRRLARPVAEGTRWALNDKGPQVDGPYRR